MGKARPRHRSNRKHKIPPTGLPSVEDLEIEEAELNTSTNEDVTIQNIIEEIQSPNVEEKLCGLQSLATLAESLEAVDIIIKYKVLKIMAPLLIDKSSEIRNITAGVLRNLSATGSVEVCERLVKEDIMTPLVALLHQYSDWKPDPKAEDTDTLLQLVNILWNLCETNETALNYFNSTNLLSILLRCLDYKTVGLDLSVTVCQCLNSVSEDNAAVIAALHSHESELLGLLSVNSEDHKLLFLKTLAAGIIVNLNPSTPWLASVLAVVHEAISKDIRAVVSQLSSQLPLDSDTPLSPETRTLMDNTLAATQAQTMALEILANLTSSQDDEMDVESEESASEDEEQVNGWSETEETQPLALSPEIHEGLQKYKLVSAVFTKMESLPENVMNIINSCSSAKALAKKVLSLQCRAFLCFNNLVSVVDLEQLGGPQHLYTLVKQISSQKLCLNLPQSESNGELLEAATAAIRAILLRLASIKFADQNLTTSDLQVIFNIGLSAEPRVQANVMRIVGALGTIVLTESNLVKMVGNYLLSSAENQSALWLAAEALDSLMDTFADDITDQAAAEINLVSRLRALLPHFKSKMRQERKTLGEHYPVVSTVMTNLAPFIRYKGARVAALKSS